MQGHIYRRRKNDGTWSNWYAVIDLPRGQDGRRRQRTTTHPTRREAQSWLAMTAHDHRVAAASSPSVTVGEYLEGWLEGKASLRASTRLSYRGHLYTYLIPQLGQIPLHELSATDIERAYSRINHPSSGGPLAPASVHRIHATLSSALGTALRRGLIGRNPASTVELPPLPRRTRTTWTADQAARFLASSRDDRWGLLYLLMLATGIRRGEAVALRWEDLDLDQGLLHVRRQLVAVGPEVHEGPPKSKAGTRTVVLDDRTLRLLQLHALEQGSREPLEPQAHVFARDGQALSPAFVSRHFERLVAAAGVPRIRLHDLRHTSASLGLAAGESLVEVSRRLGHSSIGVTADVYTHVDTELARESSERRADLLHGADRTRQDAALGRTS